MWKRLPYIYRVQPGCAAFFRVTRVVDQLTHTQLQTRLYVSIKLQFVCPQISVPKGVFLLKSLEILTKFPKNDPTTVEQEFILDASP